MKASDLYDRVVRLRADRELSNQIGRMEAYLGGLPEPSHAEEGPILFFNASTRIHRLSINAAISLLASWSLRAKGVPVLYAVCNQGMEQCILGTDRANLASAPPCKHCIPFSERLFPSELTRTIILDLELIHAVHGELKDIPLASLIQWRYKDIPLGELCIPGLRWALRRHNLPDEEQIRQVFCQYLASAANLVESFEEILDSEQPKALVVFNGISYPEAVARYLASERSNPVITHEVGLRPYSAFFSYKDATFREVELASSGTLTTADETQLEKYLEDRFKGRFSMAGIQFWPEMDDIPQQLAQKIEEHRQVVPIFTNVIFDTSQIHANTLFEDMFSWLNDLQTVFRAYPETLFIIRAHPDEDRPGKESRESVADWYNASDVRNYPNVVFYPPSEYISSYDLIRRAKIVLVYNSSIGLEASIMGAPVLCAGRARYTQVPTTYFPPSRHAYLDQLRSFLDAAELETPTEFALNARRFLHHELYRSSLDLSAFLCPYPGQAGMTLLTEFEPEDLDHSEAIAVIRGGILRNEPFTYPATSAE